MNLQSYKTLLLSLLATSLLLACGGDDPELETDRIKRLLKDSEWTLQQALVNGVDETDLYGGLSITFTETAYTTTQGGALWPASGTWEFADATGKVIERNDGLLITIDSATPEEVTISFNWTDTTFGEGRLSSIAGEHVLKLVN